MHSRHIGFSTPSLRSTDVTAADSSVAFLVKSLLYPVAAVISLIICLAFWGEAVTGPYSLVAVLAFVGVADFLDVAKLRRRTLGSFALRSLADISVRWFLVVGFIWVLLHLSGLTFLIERDPLRVWAFITPAVLWGSELGAHSLLIHRSKRRGPLRRAIIVGVTELGTRLEQTLSEDVSLHTELVGYCEDRSPDRLTHCHTKTLLGKTSELPEFVLKYDVNVVYITLPMNRDPRVLAILDGLRDSTASIYFVPDLFVFNLIQARLDSIDGIPLVAVCESPFFGARALLKRLCDIVISGIGIAAAAPVMLAVAIGVRLSSPGAIVFKQRRYGLDGKEITVYKFRSMTVVEDGKNRFTAASRGDARVTPFGAFIRSTSLDELPQLFNVFFGDMSIVGPRPHPIAMNEHYRRMIPSYMVRHKVKPGITGWAQVNGYRGGDDLESMTKRIEFDLEYLRQWSIGLDLMILLKTTTLIWSDKQAF
jgi:putative colanic acid biosynthesis UDP-glucose lipid carrier transferase